MICACAVGIVFLLDVYAATPEAGSRPVMLVMGDSLSAGYGIRPELGWVALLQRRLRDQGYEYQVVNASVSGETTEGGLQRLPRALQLHAPAVMILELGANDALRGLPLEMTRRNLGKMIDLARAQHAQVVLLGMRIPPNYGPRYSDAFMALYADLARQYKLEFNPFFLAPIMSDSALIQADGLHPTAEAQPRLLDSVWTTIKPLLGKR